MWMIICFLIQEKGRTAHYKLTSTVMLWLQTIKEGSGTMNLGGSLTRQSEADHPVGEGSPHISNLGRMVEVGFLFMLHILPLVPACINEVYKRGSICIRCWLKLTIDHDHLLMTW